MRYFEELDSTNRYVCEHASELPDGTLVAAGFQTAGRGRLGRRWLARPDVSIAATLYMKHIPDSGQGAGIVAGLAGLALVREFAPEVNVWLKWPNDLYIGDRKLAGILCESTGIADGRILGIAAGIGINVNLTQEELDALDRPATSLLAAAGKTFPVKEMLERLEFHMKRYYAFYRNDRRMLDGEWRKENRLVGCAIDFDTASGTVSGIVCGIAPDGEIEIDCGGTVRRFNCGDVRIRRESLTRLFAAASTSR